MIDYEALAARLREIRTSRRWTLERAAAAASLAPSTLSRIETNQRIPSLEHLVALGSAYGAPLTELLPPTIGDPRIRSKTKRIKGMSVRLLSPPTSPLSVFEITLTKHAKRSEPQVHAGREWIYVISGVLSLTLGSNEITVRGGEAAEFDTGLPHAINADSQTATVIAIYSDEGRHIHLRT